MPLRFCANLNFMFQETQNLLERYGLAKKAGFSGVECASPYISPIEDVVESKEAAKVEQILINVPVGNLELGELGFAALLGKEKQFEESLNLAIKYAKNLNCDKIHIMSGVVESPSVDHHNLYEKNLRFAVSLLEKERIIGLVEPINNFSVPNYYLNNYERAIEIIKTISNPHLKLQLDIFHLQHLKGNLTKNIEHMLPYVGHIQIAQVPNRNEPDTNGEVNYAYIFSLLEKLGYTGWIGLEYKPLRTTEEGLMWLKAYI